MDNNCFLCTGYNISCDINKDDRIKLADGRCIYKGISDRDWIIYQDTKSTTGSPINMITMTEHLEEMLKKYPEMRLWKQDTYY